MIRKEDLHETDYTPWEGHQVGAWRSLTILHGKIVMTRSVFCEPGDGAAVRVSQALMSVTPPAEATGGYCHLDAHGKATFGLADHQIRACSHAYAYRVAKSL